MSKADLKTGGIGKGTPGPGRPKGLANKVTMDVKAMIEGALTDVGGQTYLAQQARENPVAFLNLVGKMMPKDVKLAVEEVLSDRMKALLGQRSVE